MNTIKVCYSPKRNKYYANYGIEKRIWFDTFFKAFSYFHKIGISVKPSQSCCFVNTLQGHGYKIVKT